VHNSFIGYTFYAGFPAGLLVVAAFLLGLWQTWRHRHRSRYMPALFGSLVGVVLTAFTNVALETTYIGGPSWLILGAAIGAAATVGTAATAQRPEQ
jgi:O-antigen ligase